MNRLNLRDFADRLDEQISKNIIEENISDAQKQSKGFQVGAKHVTKLVEVLQKCQTMTTKIQNSVSLNTDEFRSQPSLREESGTDCKSTVEVIDGNVSGNCSWKYSSSFDNVFPEYDESVGMEKQEYDKQVKQAIDDIQSDILSLMDFSSGFQTKADVKKNKEGIDIKIEFDVKDITKLR